ncbi:hypothetical protein CHARACLAT_009169 [Characodon lateralis]|uniref:Uncharacterized protein n=1 Tax=Characodon lateralis TaxID=208331 RepID=A0ABU7DZM8_9TELE|nr:hypothetical protein [Characodon lateralis]
MEGCSFKSFETLSSWRCCWAALSVITLPSRSSNITNGFYQDSLFLTEHRTCFNPLFFLLHTNTFSPVPNNQQEIEQHHFAPVLVAEFQYVLFIFLGQKCLLAALIVTC